MFNINLIRITTICIFLGSGIKYLFWDTPLRTIFWNEEALSGILGYFNIDWHEYVTSNALEHFIFIYSKSIAILFLIISFLLLFKFDKKYKSSIFCTGIIHLALFSFCNFLSSGPKLGQLLEYSLYCGTPIMYYVFSCSKYNLSKKSFYIWRILLSLTFIGHGLFAIGHYDTPGHFVEMTIEVLGVSELDARLFLKVIGALDILSALVLLTPYCKYALYFMIPWGLGTSLARILSQMEYISIELLITQWLPEFLMRTPHFLIAYLIFRFISKRRIILANT